MLKAYSTIDDRVRVLGYTVKKFAKVRGGWVAQLGYRVTRHEGWMALYKLHTGIFVYAPKLKS